MKAGSHLVLATAMADGLDEKTDDLHDSPAPNLLLVTYPMDKLDLAKTCKSCYTAKTQPELVSIGPACFISICGQGNPSGEHFAEDIQALYATAYTIKFNCKAARQDFVVAKLEGLWWYDVEKYPNKYNDPCRGYHPAQRMAVWLVNI